VAASSQVKLCPYDEQGWEKPGLKKKPSPVVFFILFGFIVFLGFLNFVSVT
jgi:hypothetical protein